MRNRNGNLSGNRNGNRNGCGVNCRHAQSHVGPIPSPRVAFNYWEPLHLLSHPPSSQSAGVQAPFQTWEYSPEYAIRSWAYLMQYLPIAGWLPNLMSMEKVSTIASWGQRRVADAA